MTRTSRVGVEPKRYDPFVDDVDMRQLRDLIAQTVAKMPGHGAYLDKNAKGMSR